MKKCAKKIYIAPMYLDVVNKGRNKWWMYVLTILLIPAGYFIFQLPLLGVLWYADEKFEDVDSSTFIEFQENPDFSLFHLDKNVGLVLMIFMFLGVWLVLFLSLKILHKRNFSSLITHLDKINYRKIFFSFSLFLLLCLSHDAINYLLYPDSYSFQFSLSTFIPLLLIGLFILPIQTTAEELLFRGYLMQGINIFFKSPWFAVLVTSILFGIIHLENPEIEKYGALPMQVFYIGAGLLLALVAIFDGSLEMPIGIHAAINFYSAVISSYSGSVLQTDSLLKSTMKNPWISNIVLFAAFVIFMYFAGKRYNWPSIHQLLKKLDNQKTNIHNA